MIPSARLVIVNTGGSRTVSLDKPRLTIGRRSSADIRVTHRDVSREQAEIAHRDGIYLIRDPGSRSGTFVNGERITERPLAHGDRIRFGRNDEVELVFTSEDDTLSGLREVGSGPSDLRHGRHPQRPARARIGARPGGGADAALLRRAVEARFSTMFYGTLGADGRWRSCNAGHEPPVVVRARGGIEWLETGGPVLGLLEVTACELEETCLQAGDLVVLYSDGVTEARSPSDEEFGRDRILATISGVHGETPDEVLARLLGAVRTFAAGAPQADDITAMVLRYRGTDRRAGAREKAIGRDEATRPKEQARAESADVIAL